MEVASFNTSLAGSVLQQMIGVFQTKNESGASGGPRPFFCVYPGNFGGLASIAETKIGNVTPK